MYVCINHEIATLIEKSRKFVQSFDEHYFSQGLNVSMMVVPED